MKTKYFCSPRNSEFFLDYINPGAFNDLGELPSTRPLTIGTTIKGFLFHSRFIIHLERFDLVPRDQIINTAV